MANLMAADAPEFLMMITDFDSDFGVRVFLEYVNWKYAGRENRASDFIFLLEVLGRFSNERRRKPLERLNRLMSEYDSPEKDLLKPDGLSFGAEVERVEGMWPRVHRREADRNSLLLITIESIAKAEDEGMSKREDSDVLVSTIDKAGKRFPSVGVGDERLFLMFVVAGRYRYLPA